MVHAWTRTKTACHSEGSNTRGAIFGSERTHCHPDPIRLAARSGQAPRSGVEGSRAIGHGLLQAVSQLYGIAPPMPTAVSLRSAPRLRPG
jgi:hypothetical protein